MFPGSRRWKRESPRDLWGRDAGAPRSLLSLSGSACVSAGAVTQAGRYRPGVGRTTRNPRNSAKNNGCRRSGSVNLAAQRDREDGAEAFRRGHLEGVVVVGGEVGMTSRLEGPLLAVLMP